MNATDPNKIRRLWQERWREFMPWAERRRRELLARGQSQPVTIQARPATTKPATGVLWGDNDR